MYSDRKLLEKELQNCLFIIKQRTGVSIPVTTFQFQETKIMKKKWTVNGEYNPLGTVISLRPSLGSLYDYRQKEDREKCKKILCNIMMDYKRVDEISDVEVKMYIQNTNNYSISEFKRVVYHECGHYIHDKYFHNKPMRLPTEDSREYAKKNAKENFAVAFEEYMTDKLDKSSKRYQKMEDIIYELRHSKGALV